MLVQCVVSAGNRNYNDGSVNNAGSNGNYWSSTVNSNNARNLNFNSGNANMNSNNRANGFSVRCYEDGRAALLRRNSGEGCCSFKMTGRLDD